MVRAWDRRGANATCHHSQPDGWNVRVGLDDSLFISRGELATSNAQQVAKFRRIVEDLGNQFASPGEAREILDLKGGDRVAF